MIAHIAAGILLPTSIYFNLHLYKHLTARSKSAKNRIWDEYGGLLSNQRHLAGNLFFDSRNF